MLFFFPARFEVFAAVKIQDEVFWIVTPINIFATYTVFLLE